MVRLPGAKEPTKYGDYHRGFQSQFTKATQEAARLKQERADFERRYNESESQRQRYEQALRGANGQQPNGQPDLATQLKALPYLSGEDAAAVVGNIMQSFNQRDAVLLALAQKIQAMEKGYGTLQENHVNTTFEAKMDRWLNEGGYPPEAKELAKEIYLAYEGEDLDQEFPTIFKQRWEQIQNIVRAGDRAKAQQARQLPFVPGKGGAASPSRPLNQGFRPAREMADDLWAMVQGAGE